MEIKKVALVAAATMLLSTAALAGEPKKTPSCTPGYWKNHDIDVNAAMYCTTAVGDLGAYLYANGQNNPGDGSPGDSKWEAASCLNAYYTSNLKGVPCEDPIDGRDD